MQYINCGLLCSSLSCPVYLSHPTSYHLDSATHFVPAVLVSFLFLGQPLVTFCVRPFVLNVYFSGKASPPELLMADSISPFLSQLRVVSCGCFKFSFLTLLCPVIIFSSIEKTFFADLCSLTYVYRLSPLHIVNSVTAESFVSLIHYT